MSEALILSLVGVLLLAIVAACVVIAMLIRRLWQLIVSVECLCVNLGGLREQIGHGGDGHHAG